MRVTARWWLALLAGLLALTAACSHGASHANKATNATNASTVVATFTPSPATPLAAGVTPRPLPAQPVAAATCLRGLSSYRFSGSLSLRAANPAPGQAARGGSALSGSLANLLSDVHYSGAAQAPDRLMATIQFGGKGTQPLHIVQSGATTYSHFGNAAWQQGNPIAELGNLARFDPESLCEASLTRLDASGQQPSRETVNGIASLHYHFSGPGVMRGLFGGGERAATPSALPIVTATPSVPVSLDVWSAVKGGYPVRTRVSGLLDGSGFTLQSDVTDLNGKDIQIALPR